MVPDCGLHPHSLFAVFPSNWVMMWEMVLPRGFISVLTIHPLHLNSGPLTQNLQSLGYLIQLLWPKMAAVLWQSYWVSSTLSVPLNAICLGQDQTCLGGCLVCKHWKLSFPPELEHSCSLWGGQSYGFLRVAAATSGSGFSEWRAGMTKQVSHSHISSLHRSFMAPELGCGITSVPLLWYL